MAVSVGGGEAGQWFEVLVDETPRATVKGDGRALIFLQPSRSYDVRLRPLGAQAASFDTAGRKLTLYPGSVAALRWDVTPLFILFGRAVDGAGRPVADADVKGSFGIGQSDGEGYFQIETRGGDMLRFVAAGGAECKVEVGGARQRDGYVSAGEVLCH